MEPLKLIYVDVHHMRTTNLAGLAHETRSVFTGQEAAIGPLAAAKLTLLGIATDGLVVRVERHTKSPETKPLNEAEAARDSGIGEWRRTAKTASQSAVPARAAAGERLLQLLDRYPRLAAQPIATESLLLDQLKATYEADPTFAQDTALLGLSEVVAKIWTDNSTVKSLYTQRLNSIAEKEGPSAYSQKAPLAKAYIDFCDVMEQTVNTLPTPELNILFNKLNELRRKYVERQHAAPAPAEEVKEVKEVKGS